MWDVCCRKTLETGQQMFAYIPANARQLHSSFGQGSHRDDKKMCALITSTSPACHEQLNNSVLFILCQNCLLALYRQEQCGLFCSWLPAQIQLAEGKSARTETASTSARENLAEFA